jgi:hypothetical protein
MEDASLSADLASPPLESLISWNALGVFQLNIQPEV